MRRAAANVANDSLNGSLTYYRLGPQFEQQLSAMVDTEFRSLLAKKEDIPIELNQEVLININSFLNDRRGFMSRSLSRGQKYIPLMKAIFRQKGLPENLVYLALIESGYRTDAISTANAVGPWQFIASTGRNYGLTIDEWVDERRDPVKSTYAAADYLTTLHDMFNSWPLAIAAYNSGEGKIQRGLQRPGVDNYWDMSWESGFLANETKRYVPSYLAAAIIARDPAAYGLEVEWSPPDTWDEVVVTEPIELLTVAELANTTLERIQELNPHLRKLTTPPNLPDFVLRIPSGARTSFYQKYARLPETRTGGTFQMHLAKRGETLESVAKQYNTDIDLLMVFNGVTGNPRLAQGQEIIVPVGLSRPDAIVMASAEPVITPPSPAATPSPAVYQDIPTRPAAPQRPAVLPTVVRTAASSSASSSGGPVIHTLSHVVRPGDTLSGLAGLYGVNIDKLKTDNNLASNNLFVGQILNISSNIPLQAQKKPTEKPKTTWVEATAGAPLYHTVRRGDTVGALAERYHVTQAQLRELNNLSGNYIRVGQKLRIGTGPAAAGTAAAQAQAPTGPTEEYTVAQGDTFSSIATRYNLSPDSLMALNKVKSSAIRVGQKIRVPSKAQTPSGGGGTTYVVQSGDSISVIAQKFNMRSDELRNLNNLTGNTIKVGQTLKVRGGTPEPELSPEPTPEIKTASATSTGTASSAASAGTAEGEGDIYQVQSGDSISVIAEKFGMRSAELRTLNDLESDKIKVGQKLRIVRSSVSAGESESSGEVLVASASQGQGGGGSGSQSGSQSGAGDSQELYEVQRGDSISKISERFGISADELKRINNLPGNWIRVGQKLKVKASATAGASRPTSTAAASSGSSAAASSASSASSSAASSSASSGSSSATAESLYEVKSGDSVSVVAEKFGMRSAELRELNNLTDDKIKIGQKLRVRGTQVTGTASASQGSGGSGGSSSQASASAPPRPSSGSPSAASRAPSSSPAAPSEEYVVKSGDSVSVIAERFGMRSSELRELNNLTSDSIRVGQKIRVRSRASAGAASASGSSAAPSASRAGGSSSSSPASAPSAPARRTAGSDGLYVVASGDTVSQIAESFGLKSDELRALNGMNDNSIRVGQKLKVVRSAGGRAGSSSGSSSSSSSQAQGQSVQTQTQRLNPPPQEEAPRSVPDNLPPGEIPLTGPKQPTGQIPLNPTPAPQQGQIPLNPAPTPPGQIPLNP